MWTRAALVATIGLGGCFEGDLGRLVFDTNLIADAGFWSPDHLVADDQIAVFWPDRRVDDVDAPLGPMRPEVRGELVPVWQEGATIAVTGEGVRGRIEFDGEVFDRFRVRFAPADHAVWIVHPGQPSQGAVGVLEGSEVWLGVGLRDRRGRVLGYASDGLEVLGEGAGAVWLAEGSPGVVVVAGDTAGAVEPVLALGAVAVPTPPIEVVSAADVVSMEDLTWCVDDDDCTDVTVGHTASGLLVLGLPGPAAD